ncbi:toprim domain-containing protein [Pseudoruegeria sp. HB172150]|uniref:DUF7146 domain-containing protein n=1 Tax=Pseudoruegeria sp. HB172150 TaxID=2721164 RepID=UPI0015550E46|nr:toprim domain-containing protein [Pseudoruegeria sp. HB172150]
MSEAERITRALGGVWRGGSGSAPCPVCQPEGRQDQRALSLTDSQGRLLVHCHKRGCDALAELQRRGIAEKRTGNQERFDPAEQRRKREAERKRHATRLRASHELFEAGISCGGTIAQTYLESRGIVGLKFGKMNRTLRFHPSALHGLSGRHLPAMLAQIRGSNGEALGIHRTFLRDDGSGKADVKPAKMMLGPSSGGAVRFGPNAPVIALAEGIETSLSISLASRMTVWATLSTSGLKALVLPPPPVAEVVIIAADHDDAGMAAAQSAGEHFEAEGRAVSIIQPHEPGTDFNDLLRGDDEQFQKDRGDGRRGDSRSESQIKAADETRSVQS